MGADDGYLLSERAGRRLAALASLFDASTFRHLSAVGLAPGWRVWEVGAGGPSVPTWLAGRVGTSGRVLATDIDTRWLDGTPGVDVLRHDVAAEPPPDGPFDLVPARLVLVHVPDRPPRSHGWPRRCAPADGSSWRTRTRLCSPWSASRTPALPKSGPTGSSRDFAGCSPSGAPISPWAAPSRAASGKPVSSTWPPTPTSRSPARPAT